MLEGDRYEILDIVVRPDSEHVGKPFRDLPKTGMVIGAIIRDGERSFRTATMRSHRVTGP